MFCRMKHLILTFSLFLFLVLPMTPQVHKLMGEWIRISPKGEPDAIVELFKNDKGLYACKILAVFDYPQDVLCTPCKGNLYNQKIVGMIFINDLKERKGELVNGTVVDVKTGKIYHCKISYRKVDNSLVMRASVDQSGRVGQTQVWVRSSDKKYKKTIQNE